MNLNNAISDSETLGSTGLTGVSYRDRTMTAGLPASTFSTGMDGGASVTTNDFTAAQAGQILANSLLVGVYHTVIITYPPNTMGIGECEARPTSSGLI